MKHNLVVLIADGERDQAGVAWRDKGVLLKQPEVPIFLEWEKTFASIVGLARLSMHEGTVIAECDFLRHRLPTPSEHALYPAIGGVVDEFNKDTSTVTKCRVESIHFTIQKPQDSRIGTLKQQGVEAKS